MSRRRITIDLADLIAAHPDLRRHDELHRGNGFEPTSARLYRCNDGTFSARVVWRRRAGVVATTIVYVARGFRLA